MSHLHIRNEPLDKKTLSSMLDKYVDEYNKSFKGIVDPRYEELFTSASVFFVQSEPNYYLALNFYFNDNEDSDSFRKAIKQEKENLEEYEEPEPPKPPEIPVDNISLWIEDDDSIPVSITKRGIHSYAEMYMKGEYCISSSGIAETVSKDGKLIVCYPDAVYYALARTVHMPEEEIYEAFLYGDCLNINFYLTHLIKDVCRHYFWKNSGSFNKLEKELRPVYGTGYSDSNLRKMILNLGTISREQFDVLAHALNIPSDITDQCRYRIAELEDPSAFMHGYCDAISDEDEFYTDFFWTDILPVIEKHPLSTYQVYEQEDEASLLYTALCVPPETEYSSSYAHPRDFINNFYQQRGFKFKPYAGEEIPSEDIPEQFLLNYNQMHVTLPNGRNNLIYTDRYFEIIKKISNYASYLLWKEVTQQQNEGNSDSEWPIEKGWGW